MSRYKYIAQSSYAVRRNYTLIRWVHAHKENKLCLKKRPQNSSRILSNSTTRRVNAKRMNEKAESGRFGRVSGYGVCGINKVWVHN